MRVETHSRAGAGAPSCGCPRYVNGGKLGKPMGKTHRTFIEQNDACLSLLKLINYDFKRVYLLKLTRFDDIEIDVILLAVLV